MEDLIKNGRRRVPGSPCEFFEGRHQHIDLVFCIVEAKACTDRAIRKPEPFHKRLAAVVAGADEDIGGLVQVLGDLMRVKSVNRERNHADAGDGFFRRMDMHSPDLS
jgi:hypothetical protein